MVEVKIIRGPSLKFGEWVVGIEFPNKDTWTARYINIHDRWETSEV